MQAGIQCLFKRAAAMRAGYADPIEIELFHGPRAEILSLFTQADDSPEAIRQYIDQGDVIVAHQAHTIVGHIQIVSGEAAWEIKSLAVAPDEQGKGIGRALTAAALNRAASSGATRTLVSTAAADIDNLRFYQRLGFRMDHIERDAFRSDNGYPALEANGIPIRDRVWLSIELNDQRESAGPLLRECGDGTGLAAISNGCIWLSRLRRKSVRPLRRK